LARRIYYGIIRAVTYNTVFGVFRYELVNIAGLGAGSCNGINSCSAIQKAEGSFDFANFHWACDATICGVPPVQIGRLPAGLLPH